MKTTTFNLLPAIFFWLGCCFTATAQNVAQSDQITQGQQIIQDDSTSTGQFQSVSVDPLSTSGVSLQFPTSMASKSVAIQALDGGTLTTGVGDTATIGTDGSLSFSFQVTDQPGVHRVLVIDPNADPDSPHVIAVVQLEVPSPAD